MSVAENIRIVRENIGLAARRAGRDPAEITLIGVTKTVSADSALEMARAGVSVAGENRVQELTAKAAALKERAPELRWHLIGHLQTNKVKAVIDSDCVELIHSLDSLRLAEEINRAAAARSKIVDVLVEVNIAEEKSKYGIAPDDTESFIHLITKMEFIRVKGLMCIAPIVQNSQQNRNFFAKMRNISIDIVKKIKHNINMDILSMGMTQDYEAAVEEGATMVRVGTGIFGRRDG